MADAKAWFGTLGVHATVFAGTAFLFGYLRRHVLFRRFYSAKRYAVTNRRKPVKLPQSFFSWMKTLVEYCDNDISEIAGFDALTYLRLNWLGVELFGMATLVTVLIIIPTNYFGGAIQDQEIVDPTTIPPPPPFQPPPPPLPLPPSPPGVTCEYDTPLPEASTSFGTLDKITMSNIKLGSPLLWIHLVVCVFLVFYCLSLLWRYNLKCVVARLAYLGTVEPGAEANTVLVQDIPGLRTGSLLDTLLRLVQGPLRLITPKNVSKKIEKATADSFGVGAGVKIPRTKAARESGLHLAHCQHIPEEEADDEAASTATGEESFATPMTQSFSECGGVGGNIPWHSQCVAASVAHSLHPSFLRSMNQRPDPSMHASARVNGQRSPTSK